MYNTQMLKNEIRFKTTLALTPNADSFECAKTRENVYFTVRVNLILTVRVIVNNQIIESFVVSV